MEVVDMKSDCGKAAKQAVSLCLAVCPAKGTEACDTCFSWSNYNGLRCEGCGERIAEGNACEFCYGLAKRLKELKDEAE